MKGMCQFGCGTPCGGPVGFPPDPAFITLGGRYVNKLSVSQVRLTDGHAAVWLHGHVDPIHVDGAGAQAVRDWMEEMFA